MSNFSFDLKQYLSAPDVDVNLDSPVEYKDKLVDLFYGSGELIGATMPWEKTHGLFRFRPKETTIWPGINGHGKALSLDTPIITPAGWRSMRELTVGDSVFDENGQMCNVVAVTDVMHNRPCYEVVFSDGSVITADANHEWLTTNQLALRTIRNKAKAAAKFKGAGKPTGDFSKRGPSVVTTKQIADTLSFRVGPNQMINNHAIPATGPVDMPDVYLPIPPYVLGAWLGDGSSNGGGITTNDDEILDEIRLHGYTITNYVAKYHYGVLGLFVQLRELGLINNKHIPEMYLFASRQQRTELLMGLMDTDGHITEYGRCEFTNMNKALAEAVCQLALSLGFIARIITGEATLYGKKCGTKYRVTFTPNTPVFKLQRKLKRQRSSVSTRSKYRFITDVRPVASVPVRCIQVDSPSRLYLAGRAMIPTHNSQVTGLIGLDMAYKGEKVVIGSFEMAPERTLYRMVRQAAGSSQPSIQYINAFLRWMEGRLWVVGKRGMVTTDYVVAAMRYAAYEIGCTQFFIDNLAKCVPGEDDLNAQKHFMDQVCNTALDTGLHAHVVHHVRKGITEYDIPGKTDVKGSGSIVDQPDNCCIVWRNKRKEENINDPKFASQSDAVLNVVKQRNGEWEGKFGLWYDRQSMSYSGEFGVRPPRYDIAEDFTPLIAQPKQIEAPSAPNYDGGFLVTF